MAGPDFAHLTRQWAIEAGTRRYVCRCASRVEGALEMAELYADAARLGNRAHHDLVARIVARGS